MKPKIERAEEEIFTELSHKWALQVQDKTHKRDRQYVRKDEEGYTKSLAEAILYDTKREASRAASGVDAEKPVKVETETSIRRAK
jgi:hypothetical protein